MRRLGSRLSLLRLRAAEAIAFRSASSSAIESAGAGSGAPPPPPLGPQARLQQYVQPPAHQQVVQQQQQQQQQQLHTSRRLLGDQVSMNRGTLFLGSMALLVGGVALGTQADRLARQAEELQHKLSTLPAATGAAAHAAHSSSGSHGAVDSGSTTRTSWVPDVAPLLHKMADYLPSLLSHSQARSSSAALDHHHYSPPDKGFGSADRPLGGCLSPYFISDAAAKAAPAVVNIMVQPSGALPVGSSGSGFIVDPDGTILTNAHVVADAIQSNYFGGGSNSSSSNSGSGAGGMAGGSGNASGKGITVTLQDGRIFEGRLVSFDTVSDLAVLKVESDAPLPTARLGRSASLRVGEWVVALGSPLHLQNSVTAGIVSCVDRKAVELGLAGARTDHFIQTDAAINKGNSGGPLVNLFGEVVGISAMKAVAADGVSFAIPVDTALDVMRQLKEHGRVIRPYVGIKMLQLNKHNAAQFRRRDPNFPAVDTGILVPGVHPGSPAERAGLRAGDCIVGFGDRTHDITSTSLIKALGEHIGKPLQLRVARPGNVVETVTVVALEAVDPARGPLATP